MLATNAHYLPQADARDRIPSVGLPILTPVMDGEGDVAGQVFAREIYLESNLWWIFVGFGGRVDLSFPTGAF